MNKQDQSLSEPRQDAPENKPNSNARVATTNEGYSIISLPTSLHLICRRDAKQILQTGFRIAQKPITYYNIIRSLLSIQASRRGINVFGEVLRINSSTHADRIEMTSRAEQALTDSGAWVLDFKQFSNISISIKFEIPAKNIEKLHIALKAAGLDLSRQSDEALSSYNDLQNQADPKFMESDLQGSLQITFIHNEPDLRRDVLAIPG